VIANRLVDELAVYCERIEIAGSLRRLKPEVGDIELVAIPKVETDMFGDVATAHQLDFVDWDAFGSVVKNGHKYKQIALKVGVNLDLFIVTPPAQWGVQFMIRTGSAEFSHRLVTPKKYGGMMPSNLRVKGGAIWSSNHIIETPEEQDVFGLIGVPFIAPELRMK
jgi:DNA polymerase/3'-5' exonuclease PolX